MLEDKKDSLGLNFADPEFKKVHAGHLFAVRIHADQIILQDLKTGKMNSVLRDARNGAGLSNEQKQLLKTKEATFPNALETDHWYQLLAKINGETLTVSIDGKEVCSFTSEGIAHPTKRLLRLSVPKNAVVDDLKIWRKE